MSRPESAARSMFQQIKSAYAWYTAGFLAFVLALGLLEKAGWMPRVWIGYMFLIITVGVYAVIGLLSRTSDAVEYYAAGRRVPAFFNGMATSADWMSAASFIGMAGTLYLTGFNGLAFILGWTGGFCLVALFLAPYLRRFGQFTIPDFLGARYGGHVTRSIGVVITILCSFIYVVAQIYGVGLIATRLTGVSFELGIFLGLGGILVCSFLGGMKAVTWTQVAQCIVLIVAYLVPVIWLSVKHTGVPIPQLVYGSVLERVGEREKQLQSDPKEQEVLLRLAERAAAANAKIKALPESLDIERASLQRRLDELKANADTPVRQIQQAERALREFPKTPETARVVWGKDAASAARAAPLINHAEVFPGKDENARDVSRRNFLALMFCLMLGTAALPHVLTRYYTTPSVKEARESVFWSLFFIFLLYISAPALAVLVKYDIYTQLVGSDFSKLPAWVAQWSKLDGGKLLSIVDINMDNIVQLAEISIDQDIVVLATPEIGGLPYVVSGLVAAGGLAAALSTADGLLLTISNALSHDTYYRMIDPKATTLRRVTLSKVFLLVVALSAAAVAAQKPADIVALVVVAFSMAAAGFFPALVLGIFWKRANGFGAAAGMLAGLAVTLYYLVTTHPWLRSVFGVAIPIDHATWWDIQPIAAGVFGVPVGFAVIILLSLLTPAPNNETNKLVDYMRHPYLKSDVDRDAT